MLLKYTGRYSPIPLMELGIKVKTGEVFECANDKLAANYLKNEVFEEATEEQLESFEKSEETKEQQESSENVEIASLKAKITELEEALKVEKKEHTNTKRRATNAENKIEKLEKDLEEATKPPVNGKPSGHAEGAAH